MSELSAPVTAPSAHRSLLARRRLLAAAVAVAGPGAVTLVALTSVGPLAPGLLYLLAIALAAAAGGLGLGLVSGVLSFVALDFFFTPPRHTIGFATAGDAVSAVIFAVTAVGFSALIAAQRRARSVADEAADRAGRLQRSADALSEAVSPEQVLDTVLTEGVQVADARAGLIALLSADASELEVLAERGYLEELLGPWRRFPVDADVALAEAVRTGEPVFLRSQADRNSRFPAMVPMGEQTHALACFPLVVEGRTIGGMSLSFATDQDFDGARRALEMTLARQAAQALDRARLYEAAESAQARLSFLAGASTLLSSSLDYEETLSKLVRIAVPRLADWCSVDMLGPDGTIERLAVAHQDPAKVAWARELEERFPPDPEAPSGVPQVLRSGEPEFLAEIPPELLEQAAESDPELAGVIAELGLRSWICVPLKARGRTFGALSLVGAESGRTYTPADLELAIELGARAGVAVDNALLYRQAEERGDAARALAYVGDAVILVDRAGVVRFWNPAAVRIAGRGEADAIGRPAVEVVPGWRSLAEQVKVADAASGETAPARTLPLADDGVERWVSVVAVGFGEGTVYALRNVTEEHALEQVRSDFVATASHELRTPLAAVYGAVRTLRRTDVDIGSENAAMFLEMIETEADRLGRIVGQILLAGQLDTGNLRLEQAPCDLAALAGEVLASARVRAPEAVTFALQAGEAPAVRCDADKLRQVLVNLVENAIKYSPDGGEVAVELSAENGSARVSVSDEGLGIPPGERERIFEKFYRLDPALARGVGGSGLGLYISRELVERMGGCLTVTSAPGRGSTFTVELPA